MDKLLFKFIFFVILVNLQCLGYSRFSSSKSRIAKSGHFTCDKRGNAVRCLTFGSGSYYTDFESRKIRPGPEIVRFNFQSLQEFPKFRNIALIYFRRGKGLALFSICRKNLTSRNSVIKNSKRN